jgi:uncharacterized SAM-binding protein YcdF (DUF218 family)
MKRKGRVYIILMVIGILGILDTLILSLYCNMNIGIVLPGILGFAFIFYFNIKIKYPEYEFIKNRRIRTIIKVIGLVGMIFFIFVEMMLIYHGTSEFYGEVDYVVVLGAAIDTQARPRRSLQKRLNMSLKYLEVNPDAKVIMSGGQGSDEPISEADAMKKYVVERGVKENNILIERDSTSTYENFKYTKDLIGDEFLDQKTSILIITNDFHMMRAKKIATSLGFKVYGLSSRAPTSTIINNYVREFLACVKSWIFDI